MGRLAPRTLLPRSPAHSPPPPVPEHSLAQIHQPARPSPRPGPFHLPSLPPLTPHSPSLPANTKPSSSSTPSLPPRSHQPRPSSPLSIPPPPGRPPPPRFKAQPIHVHQNRNQRQTSYATTAPDQVSLPASTSTPPAHPTSPTTPPRASPLARHPLSPPGHIRQTRAASLLRPR